MEDFESRPRKAITLLVDRDKEIQEGRELKMPRALPGFNGGKMAGRSKAEGEEVSEEEDEVWQVEKEVMKAVLAAEPRNCAPLAAMWLGRQRRRAMAV